MLIDANILLFAADSNSRFHRAAADWLLERLNGAARVGLPWLSLSAFLRIVTHPRASEHPLSPERAWAHVQEWLDLPAVWTPGPTARHADVLRGLILTYGITGNLVTDAHLAAIAIEHGLTVCSADTDFARFAEIRWLNPLSPAR